jgi:predicted nucleotidyltransferase
MNPIIEKSLPIIVQFSSKYYVRRLYLFGSVLRDDFHSESDIDLLVEFQDMSFSEYADAYFGLKFSLKDLFQREIDLLQLDAIQNPYLLNAINQQKVLVYENGQESISL